MRYRSLCLLLATGLVGASLGDKTPDMAPAEIPIRKGLEIHEWGVFTIHEDLDLANADMKAEWAAMPKFFYGQVEGREPPKEAILRAVRKPVIFFHAPEALALELRIDFPGGVPAVWWPRTTSPLLRSEARPGNGKPAEPFRFLEWHVQLREPVKGEQTEAKLRPVDSGNWVESLRAVKADDVLARSHDESRGLQGAVANVAYEREKFIYYDGLIPIGDRVRLTIEKDRIAVANPLSYPVFDLTVVDRRSTDHVLVGRLAKLEARANPQAIEFVEANPKDWPAAPIETLIGQLKDAGLFTDEARSLAEVWKQEFFQAGGLTFFYRVPQEEYERLLPMKMNPWAEKLVRVGLMHHPRCEPDFAERVARLAKGLDDDDFETRERAQKRLEELGRAAFVHLKKLRDKTKSPELQHRLDEILERYDAKQTIQR
jgi:hypothetical protein